METPTQTLHRLTNYLPGHDVFEPLDDPRLVRDFESNDLDRRTWFYKRYAQELPRIELPRDLPSTQAPALSVLGGTAEVPTAEFDLPHLSRLLHLSAGIVRTQPRPYGTYLFRAAGSAGGRFPLELYVSVPEGAGVPGGVHWYHPEDHALLQVGPPPGGGAPTLIVTGIPWRTGWRYRERGYRHVYWDAGTMLSQLLAATASAGFAPSLYTRFPDALVADLIGADRVHELPVAVVALGGEPALDATGPAAEGAVDSAPREFPLITAAQKAGEMDAVGEPWPAGEPAHVSAPDDSPVESVVLARGSQRRMDASRGLSQELLRTSMEVALRGIEVPHFVVVHDVEGVAPGVYRWPDLTAPVRAGALREELYRVALDQGLARDAAFVAIGATDIASVDDREYREVHLASGLVSGRLHLLAYALGASATGMTFMDSAIPALLGERIDAVLFTCVGVPEYKSAKGGLPGAPAATRKVDERL